MSFNNHYIYFMCVDWKKTTTFDTKKDGVWLKIEIEMLVKFCLYLENLKQIWLYSQINIEDD